MHIDLDRRSFLGGALKGACSFGAAPFLRQLQLLGDCALDRLPQGSAYKALVCVYLGGGHDSFNMLVPRTGADYAAYAATRADLALPAAQILPITPVTATGRDFGLHPAAGALQTLFAGGKLAFVANVGPLVQPITRAQYQAGTVPKPKNLFSHSDQTTLWQAESARPATTFGWAGRMADFVLPLNNGSALSPAITIAGNQRPLRGPTVVPSATPTSRTVTPWGTGGHDGPRRGAAVQPGPAA